MALAVMDRSTSPVISSSIERITPEQAAEYLGQNTHNRPVSKAVVQTYAAAMERGEWELNGESIIFDRNGDLNDGQHRLLAIIASKTPITSVVIRGVERETFDTVDLGKKRTSADIFSIRGEQNAATLTAALNWLWRYDAKQCLASGAESFASARQQLELLNCHPGLRRAVSITGKRTVSAGLPPSVAGWLYYEFTTLDEAMGSSFFEQLIDGTNLAPGDNLIVLRKRLADARVGRGQLTRSGVKAAWTIKTWNATRRGERIFQLKFNPAEAFPEITGRPRMTTPASES